MSIINDDDFVLLAEGNGTPLTANTPFCKERYNNLFTEIHCDADTFSTLPPFKNVGYKGTHRLVSGIVELLKQSKKINKLKSLGFSQCYVVIWATHEDKCDNGRTCTRCYFAQMLLGNDDLYDVVARCADNSVSLKPKQPLIRHSEYDLQSHLWCTMMKYHADLSGISEYELQCRILHTKLQLQDQLTALESRLQTQTATHDDCVSKQLHDLYEYHEDTTSRLTAQASVSEQLQNQLHTVRTDMEHTQSALQTLREAQETTRETVHADLENRGEWTALVMSELKQRETEVVALRTDCERFRAQMEYYQKETKWMTHVCLCFASLLCYQLYIL